MVTKKWYLYKKLSDVPSLESELWGKFKSTHFEKHIAISDLTVSEILNLLVHTYYFNLKKINIPTNINDKNP